MEQVTQAIKRACANGTTASLSLGFSTLAGSAGCQENLQVDDVDFWPLHIRIIMTFIFVLFTLIGVTGNIMVIIVVFKVPHMVSPTNCYLVSLAASDCLFFLATTPSELGHLHLLTADYTFGSIGCALFSYLPFLAINTSSLSIAAFTIERYIGICHPLKARHICTVRRAKHIILSLWTFCALYNSPWLYLAALKVEQGKYSCSFKLRREHFSYKAMFLSDLTAFYITPMILYIVLYSRIALVLHQSTQKERDYTTLMPRLFSEQSSRQKVPVSLPNKAIKISGSRRRGKNQVVKMLALVAIVFAMCWLPYRFMVTYNSFAKNKWDPDWYIFFSKTMVYVNCAVNPILYNVMSVRFRNAFLKLLRRSPKKDSCTIRENKNGGENNSRRLSMVNNGSLLLNCLPTTSSTYQNGVR